MGEDVEQYPPYRITFMTKAFAQTRYSPPQDDASEAELYEHALGFLDRFIEEAEARDIHVRHRLDAQSIVWGTLNLSRTEGGQEEDEDDPPANTLEELARELNLPVDFLQNIATLLEEKKQVIFQGPPGTGKTFVARSWRDISPERRIAASWSNFIRPTVTRTSCEATDRRCSTSDRQVSN